MEEVCELVKYTCDVWEMNRKPERWKGGTSCKRGRLRKLSKEWLMKRRAWRKDSESEHLSDKMSVIDQRKPIRRLQLHPHSHRFPILVPSP